MSESKRIAILGYVVNNSILNECHPGGVRFQIEKEKKNSNNFRISDILVPLPYSLSTPELSQSKFGNNYFVML